MARDVLISVLTPVYNTEETVLRECVGSVLDQTYGRWELILVDDGSPDPHVWPLLQEFATIDPRIIVRRRERNGGIVAASNDALDQAQGEVVALLDHDDLLHRDALAEVAAAYRDPQLDYLYSDEDLVGVDGIRFAPFWKPDWSPERFRSQMYACHLSAIRRSLVDEVGRFREGYDGSQDWDLILRVTERARVIRHLPKVLYHWRIVPNSVLSGDDVKPYAYEAGRRALEDHCERVGIDGTVEELERRGHFRIRRRVDPDTLVSIVIPTRGDVAVAFGRARCCVVEIVEDLIGATHHRNIEIIVVADVSTPVDVVEQLMAIGGDRLRIVEFDRPFNFSEKCNVGAAAARGELLLFLNDDTAVLTPDWLTTMAGFLAESDVGAVGATLLFEDGRLQHAGHLFLGGNAGHVMFGMLPTDDRNRGAVWLDREVVGVTAACLMMRRSTFVELDGFNEALANNYNDVELCLRLRAAGYRIVVTPHARLTHFESVSRDPSVSPAELELLSSTWARQLAHDPYYSASYGSFSDAYPDPVGYPAVPDEPRRLASTT